MEFLTNPQTYDICFSVASLVLIIVTLMIHLSEEKYFNKQRHIFGALVIDAFMLNIMGLFHNLYLYNDLAKEIIGYEANCLIVLVEKLFTYLVPYFSICYVMSIFQIESKSIRKKLLIVIPTMYSMIFYLVGYFTNIFFVFTEDGKIDYIYPQGASVNINVYLYFIFAAYLLTKYSKSLSSEKATALWIYFALMVLGIPIRILTKSSSIFEFSVSIALLLCVYTFQNPSEFVDSMSGAGTKNALRFTITTNLLQKKEFTLLGIRIDRLTTILGEETLEDSSELLNQISDYLKQLAPNGYVFYPELDDFVILFPGVTPDEIVVEKTAEQIRKRFKDTWKIGNEQKKLFETPYAIAFPDEVSSIERYSEIRDVLDKALSKQSREILRVADLNLKVVEHDKKIDNIVKRAIEDELLEVYYQPIYTPVTGKFSSCEALLRLKDPHLGFISPAILMPIAERNGTILSIDKYVLSTVCDLFSATDARKHGLEYVEVNLSVVDCIQANLVDNIMGTLDKYKVAPTEINFEITETYEQGITSVMDENIKKLMEMGFKFSMDDFGTGYSNIARVATMPVTIFKLDKSIIQSAFESEVSYMVMINLIKIIKSLKKEIVAEGIETGEQARQLIKLGCDHIQGFFYARPMPKEQFLQFLKDHNG
ncbi:GGDEF domain-containing phosphodiesterase [Butyrivibrio sp. YAB3001]|uniref:GGDEF domain-containing phosphodiesterase n=1 Tax=Butyrivibrio sp. YAB3001 TaxID=1520812 RepID=UPI0008F61F49|nr:GGDEF domain-containing phosphodiesterase [Butyrivibrio sp. YAB3001]SFB74775.1 EAL domain, c-di-GMP-specific phosphodiesterase class I (or its enzymatically inactive variant) [Butyrivibrio sp. YAB3001]